MYRVSFVSAPISALAIWVLSIAYLRVKTKTAKPKLTYI